MLDLARAKKGERLVDMGSGDGAIIIAAGQRGLEAHGFEVNPYLIWKTRQNIRKAGLEGKVFVHWKDMWKASVKDADVVTIFAITWVMKKMGEKLLRELPKGSRVVTEIFKFPNWKVAKEREKVFLYIKE